MRKHLVHGIKMLWFEIILLITKGSIYFIISHILFLHFNLLDPSNLIS